MAFPFSSNNFGVGNLCKLVVLLLISGLLIYPSFISIHNHYYPNSSLSYLFSNSFNKNPPSQTSSSSSSSSSSQAKSPTNLSHLAFGLLGSEKAWHSRIAYIESWWRPNLTHGFLYLDKPPSDGLLPWSKSSPPYRISHNLTEFLHDTKARAPVMIRMVHGIMELFKEEDQENLRWLVMGDDDSVFMVDNIVDVLAGYDHTKYIYIGGHSEFVMSNYWFSFDQGFGGAGFMLSYPLAKALAMDMENCLRRHANRNSADLITMLCIADIGINLSPHRGIHQIDLRGDISGFLSSHPKSPLLSLHHLDKVKPIFPTMDRFESTRHLMKAVAADQSRMLQQIICHHRQSSWSFSISWGYSAHLYERIMPRSYLQMPMETFEPWSSTPRPRPLYMFNTRLPSDDPCEAPHVFFFQRVEENATAGTLITTYSRAKHRGLPPCFGNRTADVVSGIRVASSATKRKEMDRCECCDIVGLGGATAELKVRECLVDEIIA